MSDFPFLDATPTATAADLPMFREYAWNFEQNCFELDKNGEMILLEGNAAIKQWIYKAFRTERFSYLAYSWSYGFDGKRLIGAVMSVGERRSEFRRGIIECLMVNPYIKSVDAVEFTESGTNLSVDVTLTTIYGKLAV